MRITTVLIFGLIGAMVFIFTACSPIYYASNAHNVPLLKEKHEVRISGGLTGTEYLSGPDVQVAYAVGKNTGLIANGTYLQGGEDDYGYLAEAAGGFFKVIERQMVAEIYGGAGFAKVVNQRQYYAPPLYFIKPFLQPAIGFSSDYFDLAFSPKIAWVHYNVPLILDYPANANSIHQPVKEKQTFFAFEPGLTIRGGWKYVKLQLQAVSSIHDIPNAEDLSIHLGLSVNLASRFKKSAE